MPEKDLKDPLEGSPEWSGTGLENRAKRDLAGSIPVPSASPAGSHCGPFGYTHLGPKETCDVCFHQGNKEIIRTDPVTGGQKAGKLEEWGLLPWEQLAEVAKVYGYGAKKYTRVVKDPWMELQNLASRAVIQEAKFAACVRTVMIKHSNPLILDIDSASSTMPNVGPISPKTNLDSRKLVGDFDNHVKDLPSTGSETSKTLGLLKKMQPSSLKLRVGAAQFAEVSLAEGSTWIIVTTPASSEAFCVESATRPWVFLTILQSVADELPSTLRNTYSLNRQQIEVSGQNNWLRGYPWTWSMSALMRHLTAWIGGQRTDPESGLSHLAHCIFHLLALMNFEKYNRGTDDLKSTMQP